jgi:hypothetical protein
MILIQRVCSLGGPYPSDPDDSLEKVRDYSHNEEIRYERDHDDASILIILSLLLLFLLIHLSVFVSVQTGTARRIFSTK